MSGWQWFGVWLVLGCGALLVFALIGRSLWRKAAALGREGLALVERLEEVSRAMDQLQDGLDEPDGRRASPGRAAAGGTQAPYRR